jgi:LPS export ABC transporter protein LptC
LIYRLLILLGMTLVGVAVWLTLAPRQTEPATARSGQQAGPDLGYSAGNASVVETGADGRPMYTLQAREVRQDPADNLVNLTDVHMTFHDSSGGQWQARADRAVARQDSPQIDLSGSIDGGGTFAGSDQPIHFTADTLHIDTGADLVQTQSAVTFTSFGKLLNARGMQINLKGHHVKLDSQVHGQFLP